MVDEAQAVMDTFTESFAMSLHNGLWLYVGNAGKGKWYQRDTQKCLWVFDHIENGLTRDMFNSFNAGYRDVPIPEGLALEERVPS